MTADICKLSLEWAGISAAGERRRKAGKVWRGQRAGAWQMPALQILASSRRISSQPGLARLGSVPPPSDIHSKWHAQNFLAF